MSICRFSAAPEKEFERRFRIGWFCGNVIILVTYFLCRTSSQIQAGAVASSASRAVITVAFHFPDRLVLDLDQWFNLCFLTFPFHLNTVVANSSEACLIQLSCGVKPQSAFVVRQSGYGHECFHSCCHCSLNVMFEVSLPIPSHPQPALDILGLVDCAVRKPALNSYD